MRKTTQAIIGVLLMMTMSLSMGLEGTPIDDGNTDPSYTGNSAGSENWDYAITGSEVFDIEITRIWNNNVPTLTENGWYDMDRSGDQPRSFKVELAALNNDWSGHEVYKIYFQLWGVHDISAAGGANIELVKHGLEEMVRVPTPTSSTVVEKQVSMVGTNSDKRPTGCYWVEYWVSSNDADNPDGAREQYISGISDRINFAEDGGAPCLYDPNRSPTDDQDGDGWTNSQEDVFGSDSSSAESTPHSVFVDWQIQYYMLLEQFNSLSEIHNVTVADYADLSDNWDELVMDYESLRDDYYNLSAVYDAALITAANNLIDTDEDGVIDIWEDEGCTNTSSGSYVNSTGCADNSGNETNDGGDEPLYRNCSWGDSLEQLDDNPVLAVHVCDEETGEWVELEDIRPTSVEVGCDEEPNEEELDASNLADLLNEYGEILIVEGNQGVRLSFMNIVGENEQGVNRAEMMKIIVEGFSIPEQIDDLEEFDDLEEGEWYDGFILEIVISSGEEIDFTPGEVANRSQIMQGVQYQNPNWVVYLEVGVSNGSDYDMNDIEIVWHTSVGGNRTDGSHGDITGAVRIDTMGGGGGTNDGNWLNAGRSRHMWAFLMETDENGTVTHANIVKQEVCAAPDIIEEGDSQKETSASGGVDITGSGDVADLTVIGGVGLLIGIGVSSILGQAGRGFSMQRPSSAKGGPGKPKKGGRKYGLDDLLDAKDVFEVFGDREYARDEWAFVRNDAVLADVSRCLARNEVKVVLVRGKRNKGIGGVITEPHFLKVCASGIDLARTLARDRMQTEINGPDVVSAPMGSFLTDLKESGDTTDEDGE